MHAILILFVLVLVLVLEKRKFLTRIFDTFSRTRASTTTRTKAVAQRAKAVHLTSVICVPRRSRQAKTGLLYSET